MRSSTWPHGGYDPALAKANEAEATLEGKARDRGDETVETVYQRLHSRLFIKNEWGSWISLQRRPSKPSDEYGGMAQMSDRPGLGYSGRWNLLKIAALVPCAYTGPIDGGNHQPL